MILKIMFYKIKINMIRILKYKRINKKIKRKK